MAEEGKECYKPTVNIMIKVLFLIFQALLKILANYVSRQLSLCALSVFKINFCFHASLPAERTIENKIKPLFPEIIIISICTLKAMYSKGPKCT